ncbi:hypothetical protein [Actinoallomurus rhizosphaericola]|uniref:hypothetical protein n=1 Tax=Actinoallomurus rhizosphaericola TaxID=2952536 RepID=UPI0020926A64|nr:hypothetical protein [Actinoallomurus rhizosphaericola]MCO5995741.1 hypothetical protein [Actinoallomurus rhizosphaericola]
MADITDEDLDECTRIINAMWAMDVANSGHERQADHAAGMLLSGSTLQTVAPGQILELVDRVIQLGYIAALEDVRRGVFDDAIMQWRPDLAED